jgi:Leucine-rich repeat (LRR) protein
MPTPDPKDERHLDLSKKGMTEMPPQELWRYASQITLLDLHQNKLETLCSFAALTNLTSLDISCNYINHVSHSISGLTNLVYLRLSDNYFAYIPPCLSKLTNLEHLEIQSRMHDQSIFFEVTNLVALKSLRFDFTELFLSHEDSSGFPLAIVNFTNLTLLTLPRTEIERVPSTISRLVNLTTLNLGTNHLRRIPSTIASLTNLSILK